MANTASNVTSIESKQLAPACAKLTIGASLEGFPIQIEVDGNADRLRAMIDRLKAIGAQPPVGTQVSTPTTEKPADPPVCPVHNAQMKPSQKPGAFFCPKKNDDGSYCKHKA